jgi:hypothetical protein
MIEDRSLELTIERLRRVVLKRLSMRLGYAWDGDEIFMRGKKDEDVLASQQARQDPKPRFGLALLLDRLRWLRIR